ncbi:MAG: sulfatase-like hydrolase/transferase [Xanthomonadales bacterium]|nr:sulfatase-like hydrolase/transferase [Xanthomonadales bacterium]
MPTSSRNPMAAAGVVLALLLLLVIAVIRAHFVDAIYAPVVGCDACFVLPALTHDLTLVAAALLWITLILVLRARWLRVLLLAPLLLFIVLLIADVALLRLLAQRLLLSDLFKFGHELAAIERITRAGFSMRDALVLLVLLTMSLVLGLLLRHAAPLQRRGFTCLVLTAAAIAAVGAWGRSSAPGYVHADAYRNWVEVNLAQSIDAPYSEEFLAEQRSIPVTKLVCAPGQARPISIILVVVESLSAYHSSHYATDESYVPALDALAVREGSWFSEFIANGFTTDGGLIATITGRAPIPGFFRYSSTDAFAGFDEPAGGFVDAVRASHASAFFTTATLDFVETGVWLPKLGFEHYEGAEAPFYAGMPRGIFGAADDAELFARVIDWYHSERDPSRPFAAALLTVATHPPFLVRGDGERSERRVFADLDRALVAFHESLRRAGYFENGLLLITGDHRSMTPLSRSELDRYGPTAFARVPLFVFGADLLPGGAIRGLTQQTDLPVSLRDLTAERACRDSSQGLFLRPDPIPATYALHARGMPRSQIDVYRREGSFALQLAGDDSRWVGAAPPDAALIAARIHLDRARRSPNRGDLLERLIELNAAAADHSMKTSDSDGQ